MIGRLLEGGWVRPDNRALLLVTALAQVALIAVPVLWGTYLPWIVSGALTAAAYAAFSVRRTLLLMALLTIAVPSTVLSLFILPGGVRLQEGLFLVAAAFGAIDWMFRDSLDLHRSPLDVPVAAFLGSAMVAAVVGVAAGNLPTVILRDLRFPLYYGVVFLVVQSADARFCLERLVPVFILASVLVSAEYVLEFIGAIDLSTGNTFVRVARVQGIVLPAALLLLVNQMVHDPGRHGSWKQGALFLAICPAFVLTVGRGMWLAFAVGLLATVLVWHQSRPRGRRRAWQAVALTAALGGTIVGAGALFQRFTGAAISAHALERLTTVVDFTRDVQFLGRLSSYVSTMQHILLHPVLGSGQGATLPFFYYDQMTGGFGVHESWTVDSLYLSLLWKAGVVGLVAFAWMALAGVRLSLRTFQRSSRPEIRAFCAGMVAVGVCMGVLGISDSSLVGSRFTLVFGLLLGVIAVVGREADAARGNVSRAS